MKNVIKTIVAGSLTLGTISATAGYTENSYFEALRVNTTVAQEAAYQLEIEALRSMTVQSSLLPGGLFPNRTLQETVQSTSKQNRKTPVQSASASQRVRITR